MPFPPLNTAPANAYPLSPPALAFRAQSPSASVPHTPGRMSPHTPEEQQQARTPSPMLYRGDRGKEVSLCANYIPLAVKDDRAAQEYELRFSPQIDSRDARFRVVRQLAEVIGNVNVSAENVHAYVIAGAAFIK